MGRQLLLSLLVSWALGTGCRTADMSASAPAAGSPPIPIAVVPFAVMPGAAAPSIDVAEVIRADLAASGRFAPLDVAAMPGRPSDPADIRYGDWQTLRPDYLVVGRVAVVHDGGHEVEFQVVDARTRTTLFGFMVPSAPDELPLTAREIAGMVDRRIAG